MYLDFGLCMQGGTALHHAVDWGRPGHVPMLLAFGADLDVQHQVGSLQAISAFCMASIVLKVLVHDEFVTEVLLLQVCCKSSFLKCLDNSIYAMQSGWACTLNSRTPWPGQGHEHGSADRKVCRGTLCCVTWLGEDSWRS